jgi:hypothetical protein
VIAAIATAAGRRSALAVAGAALALAGVAFAPEGSGPWPRAPGWSPRPSGRRPSRGGGGAGGRASPRGRLPRVARARRRVALVEVGGRRLLVGYGSAGVQLLADAPAAPVKERAVIRRPRRRPVTDRPAELLVVLAALAVVPRRS